MRTRKLELLDVRTLSPKTGVQKREIHVASAKNADCTYTHSTKNNSSTKGPLVRKNSS